MRQQTGCLSLKCKLKLTVAENASPTSGFNQHVIKLGAALGQLVEDADQVAPHCSAKHNNNTQSEQ